MSARISVHIPSPSGQQGFTIGSGEFACIAGPCSIDSYETFAQAAESILHSGGKGLRAAVFKMRTHPDSFQGLGASGLTILSKIRARYDLPLFTEVVDPRHLAELDSFVDVYQVGARNMYNYELLKELGGQPKPVLLKRGLSATLDEWSGAAEYVLRGGNRKLILCERGVRGFDPETRNLLDLASVPLMKRRLGAPVIVDPSHGTGRRDLVIPLSLAAAAVGADGLLIEVHPDASSALSDADQALSLQEFKHLVTRAERVYTAAHRASSDQS
jgi:3-deoxy-7-phosphoheptulonate synthase